MAVKEIRGFDGIGNFGWKLAAAFTLANIVIAAGAASVPAASPLLLPALALLAFTAALPAGLWSASGARRTTVGIGRLVAAFSLLGSWAAVSGAEALGRPGASVASALFFSWLAVLAVTWVRLPRLPLLTIASVAIAVGLAMATLLGFQVTGHALNLTPVQVLSAGVTSTAFMPAVMVGGLTLLVSSLAHLNRTVPRLRGAAPMHSLAASFAGLCGLALAGIVVTSTSRLPESGSAAWLVSLGLGLAAALGLMIAGGVMARKTELSRRGPVLSALALGAVITGGWFTFTAGGLAALAALVLVALAAVLGLVAGLAWAAAVVRTGHRAGARFARIPTRRSAPAAAAPAAGAAHGSGVAAGGMASPQHATG